MIARPADPARPATSSRRWWRRLRLALLLLILLLALLLLFARPLLGPVVAHVVTGQLAERLGGSWTLERVESLRLSGIILTGLEQTEPREHGAIRHCRIDRLVVGWRPLALVGPPLGALSELRCTGIELALAADRPLLVDSGEAASPTDDSDAAADLLQALDPQLQITVSGSARLAYGERSCRLEQFALHGRPGELLLGIAPWSVDDQPLRPLHARWHSTDLATGGSLTAFMPVLGQVDGRLERTQPTGPWQASLSGQTTQGTWSFHLGPDGWRAQVDALDLGRTLALLGDDGFSLPPALSHHSRLWVEAAGADGRIEGQIRFTAGAIDGPAPISGQVEASWDAGTLLIASARVDTSPGRIAIRDLQWSPELGISSIGHASASNWVLPLGDPQQPPVLAVDLRHTGNALVLDAAITGVDVAFEMALSAEPRIATADWQTTALSGDWRLEWSLPQPQQGTLTSTARIGGTPGAPEATIVVSGDELQWGDLPQTALSIHVEIGPGRAVLEQFRIVAEDWQLDLDQPAIATWSPDGSWQVHPLRLGRHHLHAAGTTAGISSAGFQLEPIPLQALAMLSPELSGITGSLAASLEIGDAGRSMQTRWLLRGMGIADHDDSDDEALWDATLGIASTADGVRGEVQIDEQGGPRRLQAEVFLEHAFAARWDWPQAMATAPLTGNAEMQRLDMQRVADLVPAIAFARGHIDGHAEITGSVAEPDLRGQIQFDQVDVSTSGLPPITALTGILELSPQTATTSGLHCRIGYAPLRLAGSWSLEPEGSHDLRITGDSVLLIEEPDLRVRADLDCRLHGPVSTPVISGRVGVTEFLYSAQMSWLGFGGGSAVGARDPVMQLFSIEAEPWNRLRFDLRISDGGLDSPGAGDGLSIRTPIFAGDLVLDLRLAGNGQVPEPIGTISTSSARAMLPFTTYTVESATVRFLQENPFQPTIVATLHTRMAGYDVRLQVEGPIDDPRLSVTTSPPLPADSALVLATTGLTPVETTDRTAAAIGTAIPFLGRELKRLLLGPGDPDAGPGLLDRLELRIDEERSEAGLATARVEFQLSRHWYLFAERDRFEDYNGGLMWRFSFGDNPAPPPFVQSEPEPKPSPIVWRIEKAEAVPHLPITRRALRRELRRQRRAFDRSDGDPLHAFDAAAAMTTVMRREGYPQAQTELVFKPTREDPEAILFVIDPGMHWSWGEVAVEGVPVDNREEIAVIARSHTAPGSDYVAKDLNQAVGQIRLVLQLDGYANAQVTATEPQFRDETGDVVATIQVEAGIRHVFAAPRMIGGEQLPPGVTAELRLILDDLTAQAWMHRTAVITRAAIESVLKEHGHQWAKVEFTTPEGDLPRAVRVTYHLQPGPVVQLEEITLSGFQRSDEDYVRKRLDLRTGKPLVQSELERGLSRLRQTVPLRRLNSELTAIGPADADRAVLDITAEEAPSQHLDLKVGYGSYVGLLGGTRYRDENLFGRGRQWIIGGEISQKHYQGTTSLADRDLLGGDRQLTLTGEYARREEPSFIDTRASIEPAVRFPLTEQQTLRVAYLMEFTQAEDIEGAIAGAEIDGFVRTARFDLDWTIDTRDDRWLPNRGWMAALGAGIADHTIGSQLDFIEIRGDSGVVVPLWGDPGTAVLALRVHGTTRKPTTGRETLPIQERLFLGGANSVRSFGTELLAPTNDQDIALGGLTAAFAQAEVRFRLGGRIHAALFYDIGSVDPEPWALNERFGQAIGAGLRYHLPVGPVRFDFGYNPGDTFAEDERWATHLAVGFTF